MGWPVSWNGAKDEVEAFEKFFIDDDKMDDQKEQNAEGGDD